MLKEIKLIKKIKKIVLIEFFYYLYKFIDIKFIRIYLKYFL